MNRFSLLIMIFLFASCQTWKPKPEAFTSSEKCNLQPQYVWFKDQCILKNSIAYQEFACSQRTDGATWIHEVCLSLEEQLARKASCINKNDGSRWIQDPNTALYQCVSAVTVIATQEDCVELNRTWENGQCLPKEALECRNGGDVWSEDGNCITKEAYTCEHQTIGAKWDQGRCKSVVEQNCEIKGPAFRYEASQDFCREINFAELCATANLSKEVRITINAILSQVQTKDCVEAGKQLVMTTSLDLSHHNITALTPLESLPWLRILNLQQNTISNLLSLSKLKNLITLRLSQNKISDLTPLEGLTHLQHLYLSQNFIEDLSPIQKMKEVRTLFLNDNAIKDLQGVGNFDVLEGFFGELETLDLSQNCKITDITQLANLPKLTNLVAQKVGVPKSLIPDIFQNNKKINFSYSPCQ
jgi:hypothetical protein